MLVPDAVRKCVLFLGYEMADGQIFLAGSAFYLAWDSREDGTTAACFIVTAKHVLDGISKRGLDKVCIRFNTKAGGAEWVKSELDRWHFHPSDATADVAILPIGVHDDFDHIVIHPEMCVTPELMLANEVGLGDEVFIAGLFRHHYGSKRNIPIVRVGNLAAMSEEQVETSLGPIDAYLIEARSVGGLSGSPVFLNLGLSRVVGGRMMMRAKNPLVCLLGLVHGHYDVPAALMDQAPVDAANFNETERVNTGIAIVVPMHKIAEVVRAHSNVRWGTRRNA